MTKIFKLLNVRAGILATLCSVALLAVGCIDESKESSVSASVDEMFVGSEATSVPVTVYSSTDWTALSSANWLHVSQASGKGTTPIQLLVEECTVSQRTATVEIKARDSKASHIITVTQYGPTYTEFRVAPQTITLGAKASTGNSFVVSTQHTDATVSAVVTVGADWIKNLASTTTVEGHKTVRFTFDALENTDAYERAGLITVTVSYGRRTYTTEVAVIQNGLGTPSISTAPNAYMMYNQTIHTQDLWVEDGDQTNVSYRCEISSAQSGTNDDGTPWITGATVNENGILTITALENKNNEMREGDVLIIATRGAATAKTNVHVIQSGYLSAGLNLPSSVITHNYSASSYSLPLNPINNSKVEIVANNSGGWVKDLAIADGLLKYSLDAYPGGMTGTNREATITLKASNGNSNFAFYYLTIRQYSPESAGLSLPVSVITVNGFAIDGVLPLNAQNSSTITIANANSTASWVNGLAINETGLVYHVDAYDGAEGTTRETVITLKAANANANASFYYVTVRQYSAPAAGISTITTSATYNSTAQTAMIPVNSLNKSTVTVASVSKTWLTGSKIDAGNLTFALQAYDGAEGDYREAVVTLKAVNSNVNAAYYYLTVRQYAPMEAGISLPVQLITHSYQEVRGAILPLNAKNGSTVTVAAISTSWITRAVINNNGELEYDLSTYDGKKGEYREGVITLKAANTHVNAAFYYLTIRQYEPTAAAMETITQTITLGPEKHTGYQVSLNRLNNANVALVSVAYNIGTGWISNEKVTNDNTVLQSAVLTFDVAQYDGAEGDYREAIITLNAYNEHYNSAYYYLVVRQLSPAIAAISMPTSLVFHTWDQTAGQLQLTLLNHSTIKGLKSSETWLGATNLTVTADTVLAYSMTTYDGKEGAYREGVITITVQNDHFDDASYYVTVRQYEPNYTLLDVPTDMIQHDWNAIAEASAATLQIKAQNNSSILKVKSSENWLGAKATGTYPNFILNYWMTEYKGGEDGDYREAIITLTAKSDHINETAYYITVRQYAPNASGISPTVSYINLPYNAIAQVSAKTLPLNAINNSTITAVSAETWLKVSINGNDLVYYVDEYSGFMGSVRSAVVTLTASNAHVNNAKYQITFNQYAPSMPSISTPVDVLTHASIGVTDYQVPLIRQNGTALSLVGIKYNVGTNWITSATVADDASPLTTSTLTYTVASYNGNEGDVREAVITLKATNANFNSVEYQIIVRQYAPGIAAISQPVSIITHAATDVAGSLTLTPLNGAAINGTVNVSQTGNWLTAASVASNSLSYTMTANPGLTGPWREAVLTINVNATVAGAMTATKYYVTVRQLAPDDILFDIAYSGAPYIYNATAYNATQINLAPTTGATVSAPVIVTGGTWISAASIVTSNTLQFTLAPNPGPNEREGTIRVTVTHTASGLTKTHLLTIKQLAPNAPSVSVPAAAIVHSAPAVTTAQTVTLSLQNGTTITGRVAGPNSAWITPIAGTLADVTYQLTANTTNLDRHGYIRVTAQSVDGVSADYYINITQLAATAPAVTGIPTSPIIYQASNQGAQTVTLGVQYGTTITAKAAGPNSAWITGIGTGAGTAVTFTIPANNTGSERSGSIQVTATSADGIIAFYYINVIQLAAAAPQVTVPSETIEIGPAAVGSSTLLAMINAQGGTNLTTGTLSNNSVGAWLTTTLATGTGTGNYNVNYTTAAYTGAPGTYRDATITIPATSVSGGTANFYVYVRQTASSAIAYGTLPTYLTITGTTGGIFALNLQNGTTVTSTTPASTGGWLTASTTNGVLTYGANAAYTGANEYREGSIAIVLTNGIRSETITIPVRQYGADAPSFAGVPTYFGMDYQAVNTWTNIAAVPTNATNPTIATTIYSSPNWLPTGSLQLRINGGYLQYQVTAYSGTSTSIARDGQIVLRATDSSTGKVSYHTIFIRQYAQQLEWNGVTTNVPILSGMTAPYELNWNYANRSNGVPQTITITGTLTNSTVSANITNSTYSDYWNNPNINGNGGGTTTRTVSITSDGSEWSTGVANYDRTATLNIAITMGSYTVTYTVTLHALRP